MEIGPVNKHQAGPAQSKQDKNKGGKPQATSRATDTVEISTEARRKLAELADRALNETSRTQRLTDMQTNGRRKAMLDQMKHRMKTDFYNQPDIRGEIARRLADEFIGPDDDQE